MKALLLVSFCLGLLAFTTGCTEAPTSRPVAASHLSARARHPLQHLKSTFYRNDAGALFEQKHAVAEEGARLETWYDSTVVVHKASGPAEVLLSEVIDLPSYQALGNSSFSKDKNHVYYFYATSGGGFRTIVNGADPATFRPSPDYQYGFDDWHGYYCDQPLTGLNLKRRQLLYGDTVAHFVAYIKDDQHVFYEASPVPGADARTFHLVRGQAWEAEDKYHRYQCCGQHLE